MDFNVTTTSQDRSTCQALVNVMLNLQEFRDALGTQTACYPTLTNGTWSTGCKFSTERSGVFGDTASTNIFGVVEGAQFVWSCTVLESDPVYKNACCNVGQSTFITGIDPYTGNAFDPRSCDPSWCLSDPYGACASVFDSCAGVSPCNRHWLLSNIPQPATDSFMATMTLTPTNPFSSNRGTRCYDWYAETVKQAALRQSYTSTFSSTQRVMNVMNTVSAYCSNPHYKGQGECACINGYLSYGVAWEPSESGENLEYQYAKSSAPYIVNQDAAGTVRRYDAFCSAPGYPGFTAPRSVTINGTVSTYSNACASLTTAEQWSALEYNQPSLNPSKSIRSYTNFGDVATFPESTSEYFGTDVGTPLALPMPLHCWLPACVAEGVPDTAVFRNLWALGVVPCPPVCYQVSSGESIAIQTGSDFAHIHENFVSCQFKYAPSVFPFSLPSECTLVTLSVPMGYIGMLTIPIGNPTFETASEFIYTTLSAFTNAYPIVSLYNGADVVSITGIPISKYGYDTDSIYMLSVSINTSNTQAFTSLEAAITLANEEGNVQSILFQVTVWGPGGSASCIACDPTWGVDCPVSLGSGIQVAPDGRSLSYFPSLPVLPTGQLVLTSAHLALLGASNRT